MNKNESVYNDTMKSDMNISKTIGSNSVNNNPDYSKP